MRRIIAPGLMAFCAPTTNSYQRLEFRSPDPTANPYLALPTMQPAGLDGNEKKMDPGDTVDVDVCELGLVEGGYSQAPDSLDGSQASGPRLKPGPLLYLPGAAFLH